MKAYEYGNRESELVLLNIIGDHDLKLLDSEVSLIREYASCDFRLMAFKVDDWNKDLSPWNAPAVFGSDDFGSGADKTLSELLEYIGPDAKNYIIGGYSLAALFALYASTKSDSFKAVAAASPSLWFPGFASYLEECDIRAQSIYISLGNKEAKTRNKLMATVEDNAKRANAIISDRGINTIFELNDGNHFKDVEVRVAKAFTWCMESIC